MVFTFSGDKPLYVQIAQQLEDAIFTGAYQEETQIPSTTELSVLLKMNPATVLKGMNILVEENIIYKKRGLGMYVCTGAVERIKQKRQQKFFDNFITPLVSEAKKLGLDEVQIKNLIERGYKNEY